MIAQEYFSVPDLKKRGWTDTAIKKFLPNAPDDTRPNPHYRQAGAPMKFWLKNRVTRVKKTKTFLTWREGLDARKDRSTKAVGTRILNMVEAMKNAKITITAGLSDADIHKLAIATHGGNYQGDPGGFHWCNRTARNCIRHNLSNYEELWRLCNRGHTGHEAYEILRERVDALIDETYPRYTMMDEF